MVSEGSPVGERIEVGGAISPARETTLQADLVFGRIFRGGRGTVPEDSSVLEIPIEGGGGGGRGGGRGGERRRRKDQFAIRIQNRRSRRISTSVNLALAKLVNF